MQTVCERMKRNEVKRNERTLCLLPFLEDGACRTRGTEDAEAVRSTAGANDDKRTVPRKLIEWYQKGYQNSKLLKKYQL